MKILTSPVFWSAVQAICSFIGLFVIGIVVVQLRLTNKTMKHEAYRSLDQGYINFLRSASNDANLESHDLDETQLAWYTSTHHSSDAKGRRRAIRELLHFEMLFSLWEQAYLTRMREWMEETQWVGWHNWMREYIRKTVTVHGKVRYRVLDAWIIAGQNFDRYFLQYVADHVIGSARFRSEFPNDSLTQALNLGRLELPPGAKPIGLESPNGEIDVKEMHRRREHNSKVVPRGHGSS